MESLKRKRSLTERKEGSGGNPIPKDPIDPTNAVAPLLHAPSHQTRKKRRKKRKKDKNTPLENTTTIPSTLVAATKDKDSVSKSETQASEPGSVAAATVIPTFPYATEPDDHCESPVQAYTHVVPLLQALGKGYQVKLYDPYYCNGAVIDNLNSLGFSHVYNVKEDCYTVWKERRKLDFFDAVVTNPPYSGDHMERLMKFVTSPRFHQRPWFLLLPNWVHKRDYYVEATRNVRPFYLVPKKRYVYEPPKNFREAKKSDVHKKSSPFVSMWYIWGGTHVLNEKLIQRFLQVENSSGCSLARSKSALRDLRRKG